MRPPPPDSISSPPAYEIRSTGPPSNTASPRPDNENLPGKIRDHNDMGRFTITLVHQFLGDALVEAVPPQCSLLIVYRSVCFASCIENLLFDCSKTRLAALFLQDPLYHLHDHVHNVLPRLHNHLR